MRSTILVVIAILLTPICAALGQDSVRTEVLAAPSSSLWARQGWVRLEIIGGRIDAVFNSSGQVREDVGDRHEDLAVDGTDSNSSAHYDSITSTEHFSAEIVHGEAAAQRVAIRRESMPVVPSKAAGIASQPANSPAKVEKEIVELRQSGMGPVSLLVTTGGQTQKIEAPSLWHLLITEPKISEQHLIPLLESLRADWRLASTAADARQQLLKAAADRREDQRARWAALVAALGDPRFSVRQRGTGTADGRTRAAAISSEPRAARS